MIAQNELEIASKVEGLSKLGTALAKAAAEIDVSTAEENRLSRALIDSEKQKGELLSWQRRTSRRQWNH